MQDLFSPAGRRVLARFAQSNLLLAFDFDGTLAPTAMVPENARMRPSSLQLLAAAADRYPCAIVSGRARSDVLTRLGGIGLPAVVGNHGIEHQWMGEGADALVIRWRRALLRRLAPLRGVHIEDKRYSLAIHYRQAPDRTGARRIIMGAVSQLPDARVVRGKGLVNVVPDGSPGKGEALDLVRRRLRCETALYVGDDETDEDVFALRSPEWLLSVRVGRSQRSKAPWYLARQSAIDLLLERLVSFRDARG